MSRWKLDDGTVLRLLKPEELDQLPHGAVVRSILGNRYRKGYDALSHDTRYGYTAFGVEVEEEPKMPAKPLKDGGMVQVYEGDGVDRNPSRRHLTPEERQRLVEALAVVERSERLWNSLNQVEHLTRKGLQDLAHELINLHDAGMRNAASRQEQDDVGKLWGAWQVVAAMVERTPT